MRARPPQAGREEPVCGVKTRRSRCTGRRKRRRPMRSRFVSDPPQLAQPILAFPLSPRPCRSWLEEGWLCSLRGRSLAMMRTLRLLASDLRMPMVQKRRGASTLMIMSTCVAISQLALLYMTILAGHGCDSCLAKTRHGTFDQACKRMYKFI